MKTFRVSTFSLISRTKRLRQSRSVSAKSSGVGTSQLPRSIGEATGDTKYRPAHVRFAHRLIDGGVDIVHGHSSHHPRPIEVYRNRLILYGCGDFINDYEGIRGHEQYRGDLALLYFATVDPGGGDLVQLRMTPMQLGKLALNRASSRDAAWLGSTLARASEDFGSWIEDG